MGHLAKIQEALTFPDNSSTLVELTQLVLTAHKSEETPESIATSDANKPLFSYAEYALFAQAIAPMANLQNELGWH